MDQKEFLKRREKYFNLMDDHSIAIIFAGVSKAISFSANYEFIVNKNFFYLTGIQQEGSILILGKAEDEVFEHLFLPEVDYSKEKWFGKMLSPNEAKAISGISDINTLDDFNEFLDNVLNDIDSHKINTIYSEENIEIKIAQKSAVRNFIDGLRKKYPSLKFKTTNKMFGYLRAIKSNDEIECLSKAISITRDGIYSVMEHVKPNMFEYEMKYLFEYEVKRRGSHLLGFPSIVASGKNAICLHYPTSYEKIGKDDLLLCDVGASWKGYSADVTRTFPVSGKFTQQQKEIYQIVLDCNKEMIEYLKPGLLMKDVKAHAKEYLAKACVEHKLIKNENEIDKYYYHGIGHHLGLDTHDLNEENDFLYPGCVVTDEPGLYIKELGIGVRIEDDILIGEKQNTVLTKDIVKEIKDIEDLMASFKRKK